MHLFWKKRVRADAVRPRGKQNDPDASLETYRQKQRVFESIEREREVLLLLLRGNNRFQMNLLFVFIIICLKFITISRSL